MKRTKFLKSTQSIEVEPEPVFYEPDKRDTDWDKQVIDSREWIQSSEIEQAREEASILYPEAPPADTQESYGSSYYDTNPEPAFAGYTDITSDEVRASERFIVNLAEQCVFSETRTILYGCLAEIINTPSDGGRTAVALYPLTKDISEIPNEPGVGLIMEKTWAERNLRYLFNNISNVGVRRSIVAYLIRMSA